MSVKEISSVTEVVGFKFTPDYVSIISSDLSDSPLVAESIDAKDMD